MLLLGVAALNWFLQANYTGPEVSASDFPKVPLFERFATDQAVHCLSVDGELPFSGTQGVKLLLVARVLLGAISDPTYPSWMEPVGVEASEKFTDDLPHERSWAAESFEMAASGVLDARSLDTRALRVAPQGALSSVKPLRQYACWWSGRAVVTHARLLMAHGPSPTLWSEWRHTMQRVMAAYGSINQPSVSPISVELWLEVGLALYHFEKGDSGKAAFDAARRAATLHVEMTGALGRRTKFQTSSIAQLVLKASTKSDPKDQSSPHVVEREREGVTPAPLVETQAEDSILLEHTAYDEQGQGERLACAELCVLLALCLDVRNSNPKHGLTTEQMRPYVERVMAHESNWTVYSTVTFHLHH